MFTVHFKFQYFYHKPDVTGLGQRWFDGIPHVQGIYVMEHEKLLEIPPSSFLSILAAQKFAPPMDKGDDASISGDSDQVQVQVHFLF